MNMQPMKLNNIQTGFKRILLTVATAFMLGNGWAQDAKVLKGRIVNAEGEPIAGAVVNVAEASRIALSDKDGFFTLKNVKPADELYVSSVGYLPTTAIADFEENFKIVMDADLDEYAHTTPLPFNRKPKKFVTESTSIVTGEELEKHPVTVLQNAFTSTVTGVETYEAQSEPGWSETAMYIRGIRTMNASARSPLIIVDNVERDLSFLDAYPIESITILKDAAATAIYGMRGANGAILVTTKRGETGKTKINFTQEVGFQTIAGIPESQNSYNYALSRNQARYLDGLSPEYSDEDWNTTVVSATVSSWKEWPNTNTSIRTGTTPCCGMQLRNTVPTCLSAVVMHVHATMSPSLISARKVCSTPNGRNGTKDTAHRKY